MLTDKKTFLIHKNFKIHYMRRSPTIYLASSIQMLVRKEVCSVVPKKCSTMKYKTCVKIISNIKILFFNSTQFLFLYIEGGQSHLFT